ncbi:pectate lyase-like adhesive domain-containing protein [Haladaptatus caseinilyticus]|uniref:pectate lyase-like adhesive domain-containing protein n=1 Tax=Haladaptatus caseinilyticus TaxID=2993314 RepID=UPI00224B608B|nr:pectate lyase-like adhesive domain-containing protein [Haladaptatus caseinilyticus]
MGRMRGWVSILVIIVLSACVGVQSTQLVFDNPDTQKINSCTVIDNPGRYELTTNITNGGGTRISQSCIEIRSGNVVLDGNGHTIDGRGNSHTTAIQINTSSNNDVRISDMTITNWHKGIAFQHGTIGKIEDINASSNVYGISIEDIHLVITTNSRLENNLVGIKTSDGSVHLKLWGNTVVNNNVDRI